MERPRDQAMEPWLEPQLVSNAWKLPSRSFLPPAPLQLADVLVRKGSKSRALYGHCWDQHHFCLVRIPSAVVDKLPEQTVAALTDGDAPRPKIWLGRCRWARDEAGEKGHPSRRSAGVKDDRAMVVLDVLMPRDPDDGEPVEVLRSMATLFPRRPTSLAKDAPIPWLGTEGPSGDWLERTASPQATVDRSSAFASGSAFLPHLSAIEMARTDGRVKTEPLSLPTAAQRPAHRPKSPRVRHTPHSRPPQPRRPSRADPRWEPQLLHDRRFGVHVEPEFPTVPSAPGGEAWLAKANHSSSAAQASLPSPQASSSPIVERQPTGPSTIQRNGYNTPGDTVHDGSDLVSDASIPGRLSNSPSVSPSAASPLRVGGQELSVSRPPPARQPVAQDVDMKDWPDFSQAPDRSLATGKTSTGSFCRRISMGVPDASASPAGARSSSPWDEEAVPSQDLSPYSLKQRLSSRAEDVVAAEASSQSGDESAEEVAERLTGFSSPAQEPFAHLAQRRPFRKPIVARKSGAVQRSTKRGGFMGSEPSSEDEVDGPVEPPSRQGSVAIAGFQRAEDMLRRQEREATFGAKAESQSVVHPFGEAGVGDDRALETELDEKADVEGTTWQDDGDIDGDHAFEPDGAKLFAPSPLSPRSCVANASDNAADENADGTEDQTGGHVDALRLDDASPSRPSGREPAVTSQGPRTALRTAAPWAAELASPEAAGSTRGRARPKVSVTSAARAGWPALSRRTGSVVKASPILPIVTLAEADRPCIASPPPPVRPSPPTRPIEDVESVEDESGARSAKRPKVAVITYSTATPEASPVTTRWAAGWTRNKLFSRLRHYTPAVSGA